MESVRIGPRPRSETTETRANGAVATTMEGEWSGLFRIGSAAAALQVGAILLHSAVFFVAGLPGSVDEWFVLFQRDAIIGLLAFELLMVIYVVLSIPVVLALAIALWRVDSPLVFIYVGLSLVGIVLFIAARPAFEMLSVSTSHTAATTDAQRTVYLATGEAMLATFHGTAFWVSYVLGSLGGLILAVVMLRSSVFGKATAYLRIASSVLDFGLFVPMIGLLLSLMSVLCLLVFNALVAKRLYELARSSPGRTAET